MLDRITILKYKHGLKSINLSYMILPNFFRKDKETCNAFKMYYKTPCLVNFIVKYFENVQMQESFKPVAF